MSISADTVSLQPVAAPIAPPPLRQPSVAPVGERETTSNDRRKDAKDGRARGGVAFRSFLNAATFAGLSQAITRDSAKADTTGDIKPTARIEKTPARDEAPVIDAAESEQLYRSAQAQKASQKDSQEDTAQAKPNVHASVYQAASTRYAKSFFSVTGTFAKRGESLEFTA